MVILRWTRLHLDQRVWSLRRIGRGYFEEPICRHGDDLTIMKNSFFFPYYVYITCNSFFLL